MAFSCGGKRLSRCLVVHGVILDGAEDLLDATVGDFFLAADALDVDAEEYLYAVAGAVGDLGGGDAAVEPEGDCCVPVMRNSA